MTAKFTKYELRQEYIRRMLKRAEADRERTDQELAELSDETLEQLMES